MLETGTKIKLREKFNVSSTIYEEKGIVDVSDQRYVCWTV